MSTVIFQIQGLSHTSIQIGPAVVRPNVLGYLTYNVRSRIMTQNNQIRKCIWLLQYSRRSPIYTWAIEAIYQRTAKMSGIHSAFGHYIFRHTDSSGAAFSKKFLS